MSSYTPSSRAARVAANDGDDLHFCSTCTFSSVCSERGYDKSRLRDLHVLVEHIGPFREGQHIFREGDRFNSIAGVRAGTVKTYITDRNGREQVLGFFLPGEVIGLNAISQSRYPCNAIALDEVLLCNFSFSKMSELAASMPGLQQQLFRLMSEDIGKATLLAGDHTADERMAAFLILMSRRYASPDMPARRFRLTMPRTDIANFLRLAAETVSRILKRFQTDGLVRVERRDVELLDTTRLMEIASNVLRN